MIYNGQTSIGLTPTPIDDPETNPYRLTVHNSDNTEAVFVGGSAVTISTGLKLDKLQTLQLTLNPLELLYAVSSKTGHIISWLKQTEN